MKCPKAFSPKWTFLVDLKRPVSVKIEQFVLKIFWTKSKILSILFSLNYIFNSLGRFSTFFGHFETNKNKFALQVCLQSSLISLNHHFWSKMSLFLIKIKMFWNLPAARESDSNKEWRIEMRDADWPRGKTDDDSFTTSMGKILREEKLMNFFQKWYFCETFFAKIEGPNCSKVKFSRKGGLVGQKGTVMRLTEYLIRPCQFGDDYLSGSFWKYRLWAFSSKL